MAIITTAEYNTWAGISGMDAVVAVMILGAQKAIENYCGVATFDSTAYTDEQYDGSGTAALQLDNWPITALTAVKIRTGLADATPETLDTNTYKYHGKSGLLYRLSDTLSVWGGDRYILNGSASVVVGPYWPEGVGNVVVTYTAGYTTMPNDLKQAMYRLVDSLRGRRGRDGSLQSESMGAYSYTLADAATGAAAFITGEIAALLAPYRRGST